MSGKGDRLRDRIVINPDEQVAPQPRAAPTPAVEAGPEPEPAAAEPEPEAPEVEPVPRVRASRPRARAKPPAPVLATEAPDITPGRKDYRSFYVDDSPFARFRAAIYWTSRNPAAAGQVAENMSVAIEDLMDEVAGELEKRFNGGQVFPAPPGQTRRKRGK